MFLGTHTPRLDEKGRLFLPAKYREELARGLVLTKGQERCLYVFPLAEFDRITDRSAGRWPRDLERARRQHEAVGRKGVGVAPGRRAVVG